MKAFSASSFVAGLMLGALLAGAWFASDGEFALPEWNTSSATSTAAVPDEIKESGAISVGNQPAGGSVIVESVTVAPPGVWVAVREKENGKLGNVLGAVRVPGPRSSVTIPLLRATEPDRSYAVVLYRDDAGGDFDPGRNSAYIDFDTGAPAVASFYTTR